MNPPLRAYALIIFSVTMWGLVPVGMRFLLLDLAPQTAIVLRLLPAGLLSVLIVLFLGMRRLSAKDWGRLVAAALLGNLGYQVLAAFGMQQIPASWTGMIFGLEPVFIALGAALFAGERVTVWFGVGLVTALAGTALLMLGSSSGNVGDVSLIGVILVTMSTMGWAIYTLLIRPVAAAHGPFRVACLALAVTAIPVTGFAGPTVIDEISALSPQQWLVVIFLSIFGTVLATGAWNAALGQMESSKAGMFLYVQPIVAAAGGILLLSERISFWLVAGGALIFCGVAVSQVKKAEQPEKHVAYDKTA